MKRKGESLIKLVNAYFKREPLPEGEEYRALFLLAKAHSIGNLFYEAVKNSSAIPSEVKAAAKQHFYSNVAQQTAQEYYAAEVFEKLEESKIPYMPLKGYILRRLYPSPELRTSCDVDILYDKTRMDEVGTIMKAMGFKDEGLGDNHIGWSREAVSIEMHHELSAQNEIYHAYYKDFFPRLVQTDGMRYDFTPEDFYVYFLAHSAKHFTHGGFGIRTVLDIWLYRQKTPMDEEYLNAELEKLRLLTFKEAIESLADCWFGGKERGENDELLTEYILTSGTYGKSSNRAVMDNAKSGEQAKKVKRTYLFSKIFPSFLIMKKTYPIVGKAPILLPFFWVIRWFTVLFKRRKNVGNVWGAMKQIDDEKVEKLSKVIEITQVPLD